jgi:hypothetical protein
MKVFLILLFSITSLNSIFANTNNDSLFCFTKKEIVLLANTFRQTQDSIFYFKIITSKKDSLIVLQDSLYKKAVAQIKDYKYTEDLWKKKEAEYKKIIIKQQPAWYDNKFLWFGIGVIATVIISR